MVEEALVMLTEEARQAGGRLLENLDRAEMQISDAFWFIAEEKREWRLLLATPLTYTKGPIELYGKVLDSINKIPADKRGGILLEDTAVVFPDNPVVQMMRYSYGPISDGHGQRVRRVSVMTDEPFIYRLQSRDSK